MAKLRLKMAETCSSEWPDIIMKEAKLFDAYAVAVSPEHAFPVRLVVQELPCVVAKVKGHHLLHGSLLAMM